MRRLIPYMLCTLACCGGFWASLAQAVVIKDLYEALVPVETQSRAERKVALTTGLIEVLTRVSGQTLIVSEDPENPLVMAVQNSTRYTRQFRYRKSSKGSSKLNLWIKYDEKAVNNLLQNNEMPVWGHTRPATLVWVVVTENGRRKLISNSDKHALKNAMKWIANKRGLPLSFPLMDLTDRGNISISDIWGNFEDRILSASQRYNAEAVIVGRLYKTTSAAWSARWSIYQQGRRQDIDVDGEINLQVAVTPIIAQAAQSLAQQFAMVKTEEISEDVSIRISGVSSLKKFNHVIKYLKSLAAVSDVSPLVVGGDVATFKLTTQSGRLGLAQAIKLGHVLAQPLTVAGVQSQPVASGEPDLVYQLVQ